MVLGNPTQRHPFGYASYASIHGASHAATPLEGDASVGVLCLRNPSNASDGHVTIDIPQVFDTWSRPFARPAPAQGWIMRNIYSSAGCNIRANGAAVAEYDSLPEHGRWQGWRKEAAAEQALEEAATAQKGLRARPTLRGGRGRRRRVRRIG